MKRTCMYKHTRHTNCDVLVLIMRITLRSVNCRLLLYIYILAPQWKHVSYNHCAAAEITFPWDFLNLFVGERGDTK